MSVWLLAVQIAIVGWLPGAVLFRMPIGQRDRRAGLPAEERAYWAVVLSATIAIVLVLALAALHRYSFTRLVLADLAIAAALAAGARFRLRLGAAARRAGPAVVLPLALALFAAWRFLPASEYVIGGKDPGVYVNEGIVIAQRGALVYRDPVVAAVPPFARNLFLPSDRPAEQFVGPRFMGFYVLDPDAGRVVGQFPHAFPASIAIGYGLAGVTGARRAVTFWGVLGVLSVYFLGARLFGRPAAAAAALLLALNVIQVWFARYPNTDIVMQALLFAALLASARAHVDDDPFFAPVAGTLLGVLLFLRLDAVVAVAAVVAAVALGYAVRQRVYWTFWPPLVAGGALAIWYYTGPLRAYVEVPLFFMTRVPAWQLAAFAAAGVGLIAVLVAGRRSDPVSRRVTEALPAVFAVLVLALAVYAFLFRHPAGKLAEHDAYALRTFANLYFTVPALIAALVGYALVARSLFWRDPGFVLTVTAFALFFFYKIRIVPEHFWMARRFVPVILPGALLLAAAAALTGVRGRLLFTRAIRGPIGIVFLALLAFNYARAARPIVDHVEYAGVIPRLEALAARIQPDELLVVDSRDAGTDVHVLALPLAYIYARSVLLLATPLPDKATFAAFLDDARGRYRRVLFLGAGGTDLLSSKWSVTAIASERFQVPEYETRRDGLPRYARAKQFDYSLYAFGPPTPAPAAPDVDVGINDDLNVIRFHAKEVSEGHTFRWSQARSFVILNHVTHDARTLALVMHDGGRPPAAPAADVSVWLDDQELGAVRVAGGFREYTLPIPAALAARLATGEPVRIRLQVPVWNPSTILGTSDDRDLGVMVDRVTVR